MFLWWSPDTNMSLNWPISAILVFASTEPQTGRYGCLLLVQRGFKRDPQGHRLQRNKQRRLIPLWRRSVILSANLRDHVADVSCFNLAWSCGLRRVLPVPTYTHFIRGHSPSHITAPHTFSKAFSKTCIIRSDPHHYTSGR